VLAWSIGSGRTVGGWGRLGFGCEEAPLLGRVNWIVVSAIVQGISATLIALLTFFLVKFTSGYVAEMKTLNELQGQANAVSQQLLSLEMEAIMPSSVASRGRPAA
jgi:hypothetical protein